MTEDMPTVDGARAEARRRLDSRWTSTPHPDLTNMPEGEGRAYIFGFGECAEWLAPTVAALEAEVQAQRARADAAEAVIERVRGLGAWQGLDGAMVMSASAVRAALSDAAPQAVEPQRVTVAGRRSGKTSATAQAIVNEARERGVPVEVVDAPEVVETAEALDALPVGSVVRVCGNRRVGVWTKICEQDWRNRPRWYGVEVDDETGEAEVEQHEWWLHDALPARVLYRPDATDGREGA